MGVAESKKSNTLGNEFSGYTYREVNSFLYVDVSSMALVACWSWYMTTAYLVDKRMILDGSWFGCWHGIYHLLPTLN